MAHLSLLGICKLVLVFCTAVSGLYRTCFGILSNSQWAVQNLFWCSVQQSVGCTKLWPRWAKLMGLSCQTVLIAMKKDISFNIRSVGHARSLNC